MISIECLKGLPIEYESFLLEKYDSFITTCGYVEVNFPRYDIHYFLVYLNNKLIEIILFGNHGDTATCFNSLVEIDQNILKRCTDKIFELYPSIKKIKLVASYKNYVLNKSFLISKDNDLILELPTTLEGYFQQLGYHTRKNIKNRKVRLLRDYPEIKFKTKYGVDIEENIIDQIIKLNCERMKCKGSIPSIDNTYKNNIYRYSQYYGCVAYLELDGEIIAGCISTVLHKGVFAHVIAYDNKYYKYNVGEACMVYLIQTSIEKGISTFHFLWGESEFKKRFLAKSHSLFSYFIYRSYTVDFVYSKIKSQIMITLNSIRNSSHAKVLKNVVKYYRKNTST